MMDLRSDIDDTWRAMSRLPSRGGGRVLMFMAARAGEGVSSIAASFAALAAQRSSRGVWLIDLDLMGNLQFRRFNQGPFARSFGPLGRAFSADLGKISFYSLSPPSSQPNPNYLVVHRAGESRLLVSRFRTEELSVGQQVRIRTGAGYWRKVREIADWVIVDAPSLERSGAGLAICSQMDASIMVLRADSTPVEEASRLAREIEGHGGVCAGLVMNQVRADARFVDQFSA